MRNINQYHVPLVLVTEETTVLDIFDSSVTDLVALRTGDIENQDLESFPCCCSLGYSILRIATADIAREVTTEKEGLTPNVIQLGITQI